MTTRHVLRWVAATALAWLLLPTSAIAAVPSPGTTMMLRAPSVLVCDTREQVEAIGRTQVEEGLEAAEDVYMFYRQLKNDVDQPTCLVMPVQTPIVVGEVHVIGVAEDPNGILKRLHAVMIGTPNGQVFWIMWLEEVAEDEPVIPQNNYIDWRNPYGVLGPV